MGLSQFQGGVLKKDPNTYYLSQKISPKKKYSKIIYTCFVYTLFMYIFECTNRTI